MQQSLSRVRAPDGTDLAFASIGSGHPLVYVDGWLSHLQLSWELPDERAFFEGLAQQARLVRYDRAGCGLSGPLNLSPSLERELEQLGTVLGAVGDEPVDLIGTSMGALVAVAWAAAHPESVRRLVLYGGWAVGSEIASPEVRANILELIDAHWGLGSDVLTEIFAPDAPAATRMMFARYQRASSSAATAHALLALSYRLDVSDLLAHVQAPTLVVHRADDRAAPLEQAKALADGIPGAQFVVLPGRSHLPYVGDAPELVATIRRFLALRVARRGARMLTPRQLEVAALVSDGRTNREIAERLGIDERSAEGHVGRIRVRLGFRSRAQIAAWYAGEHAQGGSSGTPK